MAMGRTLQDDFELRGQFWLPENPSERVAGSLRYTPQRIELELHGDLFLEGERVERAEAICGSTHTGQCTLRGMVVVASNIAFTGDGEIHDVTWLGTLLVLGVALGRSSDMGLSGCAFEFDSLESWLATPPFEVSFGSGADPITAKYAREPATSVDLGDQGRLAIQSTFSTGGDAYRSLRWTRRASFTLYAPEPSDLDWYLDRLGDLRGFLGLVVGEPVVPTYVAALVDDVHELEIFFPVVGAEASTPTVPGQMVLTRPAIGDRLELLLQAWFARRDEFRPTVALLFGTLYLKDALPPEFRFLALTQALETFHRRRYGGSYMSEEEYEKVGSALKQQIPAIVSTDHRDALKSRIRFGNEFSQRRRFGDLLKTLDVSSRAAVTTDDGFVAKVVGHRNYLTHYPVDESPPMSATESVYASFRLRAFLWFLLLAEIGISGEEAVDGVRRTPWHRGFIG